MAKEMISKENTIILSLGGSLIYTKDGINIEFLKEFEKFIRKQISEGKRFFIVSGGGFIARKYQKAAKEVIGEIENDDVDWLGIHATRVNAHLLRTIFKDIAYPQVIDEYDRKYNLNNHPIVICSGWKPGWSTDYCAVKLAQEYKAKTIINLSNIDMVYDKDPAKYKDAAPIEKTSWEYFRTLTGDKWDPGLNIPFDPVASKLAQKLSLTVIILKGDNLDNLEKVFKGQKFVGTVIAPFEIDAAFYDRNHFMGNKIGVIKEYSLPGRILLFIRDLYRALKVKFFLNPKSLLDVGCGTGGMIRILRFLGVDARGLEISNYQLSLANPKIKEFLTVGNILNLPYKNSFFDIVTTVDVLEHIPTEHLALAIGECNRVAKKLTVHKIFTSENWWIRYTHVVDLSHASIFNRSWWQKFLRENGYTELNKFYPSLPSFMETIFLIKKK